MYESNAYNPRRALQETRFIKRNSEYKRWKGIRQVLILAMSVTLLLCSFRTWAVSELFSIGDSNNVSSRVNGVSADGNIAVGAFFAPNGDLRAFRFTVSGGMVDLNLPGADSEAIAISADGSTIVGYYTPADQRVAFRWTEADGPINLGALTDDGSAALATSADGSVVVGISGRSTSGCSVSVFPSANTCSEVSVLGTEQAFRWTEGTGLVGLGFGSVGTLDLDAEGSGSQARSISDDGQRIVGSTFAYQENCVVSSGGGACFGTRDPTFGATAEGAGEIVDGTEIDSSFATLSENGDVIGGSLDKRAALFTGLTGSEVTLMGRGEVVHDVTPDGSVAVGGDVRDFEFRSFNSFGSTKGTAFFWRDGSALLKALLLGTYDLNVSGRLFSNVTGISADGLTLVGNGLGELAQGQAWMVKLDRLPEPQEIEAADLPFAEEPLLSASLPTSRSAQIDQTVTVFASVLNVSSTDMVDCRVTSADGLPIDVDFHRTIPSTNATVGPQNEPFGVAAGASQTMVVGLTPRAPFLPQDIRLSYACGNSNPRQAVVGIDTVILSASETPVADIVVLAATATNDGIVVLPSPDEAAAFAAATINLGIAGTFTVSADTGETSLPLSLFVCQTNSTTGACLAPPQPSVESTIAAGGTPTFSVFVEPSGTGIAFVPSVNRVFIRFEDEAGTLRGASSVSVTNN